MKEMLIALVLFAVVALALTGPEPKEAEQVVVKVEPEVVVRVTVVVKENVAENPVVQNTVNHYEGDTNNVVYYHPSEEPEPVETGYVYHQPDEEGKEVEPVEEIDVEHVVKQEVKPKVRMFLVDGIREPLYAE